MSTVVVYRQPEGDGEVPGRTEYNRGARVFFSYVGSEERRQACMLFSLCGTPHFRLVRHLLLYHIPWCANEKSRGGHLKAIRVLALCLFSRDGKVLGAKGIDPVKGEVFFRPFGGGVEFGESAEQALRREIREELGKEVLEPCFLDVVENLYTFEGKQGHEIVFVFDGRFEDERIYASGIIHGIEERKKAVLEGYWISISDVIAGKIKLYPAPIVHLLGLHHS